MRFSKSWALSMALAVGVSAVNFSASADAQSTSKTYPWRAKVRAQAEEVAQSAHAIAKKVESGFATPPRDLTTVQTIETPTANADFESMPAVIYDEGKKYVRQGDVYVESPHDAQSSVGQTNVQHHAQPHSAVVAPKMSFIEKTKSLTKRLNPFAQKRGAVAYHAKDWKVPSFNRELLGLSKKNQDPITFAAVAPLPAKTSTPTALPGAQPQYAANGSAVPPSATFRQSRSPITASTASPPSKNSQFAPGSLVKTKTPSKIADLVGKGGHDFSPANNFARRSDAQVSVFEDTPVTKERTASRSASEQFWNLNR